MWLMGSHSKQPVLKYGQIWLQSVAVLELVIVDSVLLLLSNGNNSTPSPLPESAGESCRLSVELGKISSSFTITSSNVSSTPPRIALEESGGVLLTAPAAAASINSSVHTLLLSNRYENHNISFGHHRLLFVKRGRVLSISCFAQNYNDTKRRMTKTGVLHVARRQKCRERLETAGQGTLGQNDDSFSVRPASQRATDEPKRFWRMRVTDWRAGPCLANVPLSCYTHRKLGRRRGRREPEEYQKRRRGGDRTWLHIALALTLSPPLSSFLRAPPPTHRFGKMRHSLTTLGKPKYL